MDSQDTVLVVAHDRQLALSLAAWLREAGCRPEVTTSFREGREQLDARPAAVLAEFRLGAYNGLHLALRAQAKGIPAVVLGEANPITEREARQVGAAYLTPSALRAGGLPSVLREVTPLPPAPRASSEAPASCGSAGTARGTDTSAGS